MQMSLFLSGNQFSLPSPPDLSASSDMVDPPSLPRTLTWLGSRDTTSLVSSPHLLLLLGSWLVPPCRPDLLTLENPELRP